MKFMIRSRGFFTSLLAIEQSEEWLTGKRYLRMEELYEGENQILKVDPDIGVLAARA